MNKVSPRDHRKLLIFSAAGIVLAVFLFTANQAARRALENEQRRQQQYAYLRSEEWIKEERAQLVSGNTSGVYFYSTANTNSLLNQLAGMPEIKRLTFETTDLSDNGVQVIARLPKLEKLTIHGGMTSDAGLESLSHNQPLRILHLIRLDLTDNGLNALRSMNDLEYLTLYGENKLTDLAVQHLRELRKLKKLNVGGGWLSKKAVIELKSLLPDCNVVENYADDEW